MVKLFPHRRTQWAENPSGVTRLVEKSAVILNATEEFEVKKAQVVPRTPKISSVHIQGIGDIPTGTMFTTCVEVRVDEMPGELPVISSVWTRGHIRNNVVRNKGSTITSCVPSIPIGTAAIYVGPHQKQERIVTRTGTGWSEPPRTCMITRIYPSFLINGQIYLVVDTSVFTPIAP
jgi:hypothetical protein